nr:putative reverse transcriptase domain-containing protein [Tanacetum cinerariifolium]
MWDVEGDHLHTARTYTIDKEVHFLKHVVNYNGIHVDPSKIKAVKNWKDPKTSSKIRSFLRFVGYYRRFIVNFSKIVNPLTVLRQKNQKYKWGAKQAKTFQTLKDKLCKANVVDDALSRKERVKLKRVRALSMTIQSCIKEKLLAAQSEVIKKENAPAEMLHSLDQQMKKEKR